MSVLKKLTKKPPRPPHIVDAVRCGPWRPGCSRRSLDCASCRRGPPAGPAGSSKVCISRVNVGPWQLSLTAPGRYVIDGAGRGKCSPSCRTSCDAGPNEVPATLASHAHVRTQQTRGAAQPQCNRNTPALEPQHVTCTQRAHAYPHPRTALYLGLAPPPLDARCRNVPLRCTDRSGTDSNVHAHRSQRRTSDGWFACLKIDSIAMALHVQVRARAHAQVL